MLQRCWVPRLKKVPPPPRQSAKQMAKDCCSCRRKTPVLGTQQQAAHRIRRGVKIPAKRRLGRHGGRPWRGGERRGLMFRFVSLPSRGKSGIFELRKGRERNKNLLDSEHKKNYRTRREKNTTYWDKFQKTILSETKGGAHTHR